MLAALILIGIVVRVLASISYWPINADLDGPSYSIYAYRDLFGDALHPAGYSAFLRLVGVVTREVSVYAILQHLLGILAALVMFAAVRRLVGSPWPAVVAAAALLLNSDLVFLEQTIMSEALFVPLLSVLFYATVRVIEDPQRWAWVILVGALAGLGTIVRTTGIFVLLVIPLAILLSRPRPWLPRWRQPVAILGIAGIILIGYGFANLAANDRFEVAPTPGWHLYARVAPFADCEQFTPPKGTEVLCETTYPTTRPGPEFYLVDDGSPAQHFGSLGSERGRRQARLADSKLNAFARAAIIGQPKTYLNAVFDDVKRFYAPSTYPHRPHSGGDLDPQLDWGAASSYNSQQLRRFHGYMELFFDDFTVTKSSDAREVLHDYKGWLRFGGTLLSITTLLCLLGLLIGPRRSRVAVLLFGGAGLILLIPPALSGNYVGRYIVPTAAPMMAAAAVAIWTLWRMERDRRRAAAAT